MREDLRKLLVEHCEKVLKYYEKLCNVRREISRVMKEGNEILADIFKDKWSQVYYFAKDRNINIDELADRILSDLTFYRDKAEKLIDTINIVWKLREKEKEIEKKIAEETGLEYDEIDISVVIYKTLLKILEK